MLDFYIINFLFLFLYIKNKSSLKISISLSLNSYNSITSYFIITILKLLKLLIFLLYYIIGFNILLSFPSLRSQQFKAKSYTISLIKFIKSQASSFLFRLNSTISSLNNTTLNLNLKVQGFKGYISKERLFIRELLTMTSSKKPIFLVTYTL